MAEFDDRRRELDEARRRREQAADAAFRANERVKRLEARQAALDRKSNPSDDQHNEERIRLARERERAAADAQKTRDERRTAIAAEQAAVGTFAAFTDPRTAIRRFNDSIPILLFPVRLETRFRSGQGAELLVRVYPDDCSIDTFDAALSETEVANAKLYWTAMWQAGGIEAEERGAWRGLVTAHGAGRSEWIINNYLPVNLAAKPAKPLATDVILTIATEAPLTATEETAAAAYWREIWLAEGDAQRSADALAALDFAVGADRAKTIAESYVPANIAAKPAAPLTKQLVTATVAFVVFPDSATLDLKRHSWSRAPFARALPDRFVFIGYGDTGPPVVVVGNSVPSTLIVGPDPTAPEGEQLRHDADGDLIFPDEMRWMVEFQTAFNNGMAFRIPLDSLHVNGFRRVLVVGLRSSSDENAAKQELETLFEHHRYGRNGFELVPQGTPTNNTETSGSGFSRGSDADATFDDLANQPLFADEFNWLDKRDGQWLAEAIGIDANLLRKVHNSGGRDQADARAMNVALWPATLGYWMETMMAGVFDRETTEQTREFFNRFVLGRGGVPAIRIGRQPYGILPATAFSRMQWLRGSQGITGAAAIPGSFLLRLYGVLTRVDGEWKRLSDDVSFAGKSGGDAHQILLDIVGLHSGSVEFAQRYAESLQQLYNRLSLEGLGGLLSLLTVAALQQSGMNLLGDFGHTGDAPEILEKFYLRKHNPLLGPLIDDRPLSETDAIRAYTDNGRNYLRWLIDAGRTSINAVYAQGGFTDNRPPRAMLYLMLRHALQLGYHDVSVRLHESAGIFNREAAVRAKRDEPFIHISDRTKTSESRYQLLYKNEPAITGSPNMTVADYITTSMSLLLPARYLREQVQALERLENASTARLERAFADHIDCCSYRVDAWLLGLVNYQLLTMRNVGDRSTVPARKGVYLGAYAWLEEVRPDRRALRDVRLTDPELIKTFQRSVDPPLRSDNANQGYIHAPSLNHAVAAAVLRNGYLSDASAANRQTLAVNLSSERVRTALAMLEGIRGGQKLGALLGYQFERGLHDRHGLAEVDKFIFDMRKAFPLVARLASTRATDPDVSMAAIEARNVMDGLSFVEHMKESGTTTFPFGKTLPPATAAEQTAINLEAARLLEAHDAVADLALAEGVYQAVLGNYDRVASTYDAYSKGNFPPEPQVVQTPVSGIGLTHRVTLHLQPGLDPVTSPIAGVAMTPRAQAEPAINQWLASVLPPLSDIACKVSFRDSATNTMTEREVTLRDLALQPADLLRVIGTDPRQQMSELDDRVIRFVVTAESPRPDTPIAIQYMETIAAPLSVFEVMPLIRQLRRLTQTSRPLQASDLSLSNEAKSADDAVVFIDRQRIADIRDLLQALRDDLAAFVAPIQPLVADVIANRAAILAGVDAWADGISALLERASAFAIPQTGSGFAHDFRQRTFQSVLDKAAALVLRWDARLAEFDMLIAEYNAMGMMMGHETEMFGLLARAERLISTTSTIPRPMMTDDVRDELVNIKRPDFVAKRDAFDGVSNTTHTTVAALLADVNLLLPIGLFELPEITFTGQEDAAVRFGEDVARVAALILNEIDRRLAESQTALDDHDAAAPSADRVKALTAAAQVLVGKEVVLVPEFPLPSAQGDELEQAFNASGGLLTYLTDTVGTDFPLDTWLYGVARVREKMRSWEEVVMLTGGFGLSEPELTPLQLPFFSNDRWLALEFPPEATIDTDRLLYTAHFAAPFNKAADQCGLLLDEWSEVIPSADATTGVAFHYDRPNCEAPQSMLLVTPTAFRGEWEWEDLVDALNETLDLAKRRAVEPVHLESTPYTRFLPATIMAVTMRQLSISADLALNNRVVAGGTP